MEEKKNYYITIVNKENKMMCVGCVDNLDTAKVIIKNNIGQIWHKDIKYVIVEGVKNGLFMYDENPMFFVRINENDVKLLKNIPKIFKNHRCFGFGCKLK